MLISTSVFFAGCIGDNDVHVIERTTPLIDETPEEVEEIPVEEPEVIEELPAIDSQTRMIRLQSHHAIPSTLEINRGDTVDWRNFQETHQPLTLISEDGLWENAYLDYMEKLIYTFNESGTYSFSVTGQLGMSGSIVVN